MADDKNKIEGEGSQNDKGVDTPLSVGKSLTDVLNNQTTIQDDGINTNLGKFASHAAPTSEDNVVLTTNKPEDQVDPTASKIDFAKFERTSRKQKRQTKLDIRLGKWLSNKKSLIMLWLVAIFTIVVLIVCQTLYYVYINKINHGWVWNHNGGKWPAKALYPHVDTAAIVFALISMCLPAIPLFHLFIAIIIGINGILYSKSYHYVLWSILFIAIFCFIISTILSLTYICGNMAFTTTYA